MEAGSSHGHHADCTLLPLRAAVMSAVMTARIAHPRGGNVSGDDLIVVAPWLAFAAGLAVIGWRLAASRGRRRRRGLVPPGDGGGGRPAPEEAGDRPA